VFRAATTAGNASDSPSAANRMGPTGWRAGRPRAPFDPEDYLRSSSNVESPQFPCIARRSKRKRASLDGLLSRLLCFPLCPPICVWTRLPNRLGLGENSKCTSTQENIWSRRESNPVLQQPLARRRRRGFSSRGSILQRFPWVLGSFRLRPRPPECSRSGARMGHDQAQARPALGREARSRGYKGSRG
jgi:hypothetical protein